MKLTEIYFDSFKSLVNEKLELSEKCIGIVGINESGKSNILNAVRVLGEENILDKKCSPKVSKSNPSLRYNFEIDGEQREKVEEIINKWLKNNSLLSDEFPLPNYSIEFLIEYNIDEEKELREFRLKLLDSISEEFLYLKNASLNENYRIFKNQRFYPLEEALIIKFSDIKKNDEGIEKLQSKISKLEEDVNYKVNQLEALNSMTGQIPLPKDDDDKNNLKKEIEWLQEEKSNLEATFKEFNISEKISSLEENIRKIEGNLKDKREKQKGTEIQINNLKVQPNLSNQQKSVLSRHENTLSTIKSEILTDETNLKTKTIELDDLKTPLIDKYSSDKKYLEYYLSKILNEYLKSQIPKVVFWKYSQEYILNSETKFEEIKKCKTDEELPRPLMNVFRVGLNISNIEDLKKVIVQIEKDGNERSKLQDKLNQNLNAHISRIWPEYDQKVKISLEQHQIRIQFYDPNFEDRSYFDMMEKSQGAQTFLSFLLTIGAEAATGVLKNTILLLDEPEIHLHPSGVRYMLKELVKISEKENVVIYATHSIFMIDRSKYERHVYLEKKNEQTTINPSKKDRIGFFMQEEVLYGAVNVNLYTDFRSVKQNNFVFEGDGDAKLFEHFYVNILKKKPELPFDVVDCSFYQGGKCSTIIKFLKQNPIQLGSKWIFIIDKDDPANKLKKFIESHYKDYLNQDVFIFQYDLDKAKSMEIELEDLLPDSLIKKSYLKTAEEEGYQFEDKHITTAIQNDEYSIYNEKILDKYIQEPSKKEMFKAQFKTNLNDSIKESLDGITQKTKFAEDFKKYNDWVLPILEKLKQ